MNYKLKIKNSRLMKPGNQIGISIESDRGRIVNCSAVRRLQQRTQVFPLEENATIRSRLTHSLEVQQVGRYIAKTILEKMMQEKQGVICETKDETEVQKYKDCFISLVEMACLLHDIGNPPFGHFGEKAIQNWGKANLGKIFKESLKEENKNLEIRKEDLIRDLENFDGNAQGIRLIISLQQLNLTYSQIASVLKYTRGAFEELDSENKERYGKIAKKPGFFFSEKEKIEEIRKELDISSYHRFPLAYIMEAADDICYSIADLEDALDKGIVKIDDLFDFLEKSKNCKEVCGELKDDFEKAKKQRHNSLHAYFMITLRVKLQQYLVPEIAKIYLDNHYEVFEGSLNASLLDLYVPNESAKWFNLLQELKEFARENIFSDKKVHEMEIKGYFVINGLLELFEPLLRVPRDIFENKLQNHSQYALESRLYSRLPEKYKIFYKNTIKGVDNELELYYRVRLILDYISGMTDHFALKEYQLLRGII